MILRKLSPLLLVGTLLAGCSSDPEVSNLYRSVLPFGQSAPHQNPAFAAAREGGAPLFVAAIENNPAAISTFALQTRSEKSGVETWIGADGAQIMLQHGLLTGTRGFGGDVMAVETSESRALIQSFGTGTATRLMTLLSGDNQAVTRAFKCRIAPGPTQTVNQGAVNVAARTVTETCRNGDIAFSNFYWLVPSTRQIIQSSQWAGEKTQKISIRNAPTP